MKLLFVANRVPYPPFRGDKLKIWNLAVRLSKQHELELITIAENKADLAHYGELKKVFSRVTLVYVPKWQSRLNAILGVLGRRPLQVAYFRSPKFQRLLHQKLESGHFDAVHVQHLRMARFFETLHNEHTILDLPDAFSLYWKRRAENAGNIFRRLFANFEYRRLLRYEKIMLSRFPLNLVCSREDLEYLRAETGATLDVLPNGVDTAKFFPRTESLRESGRILFTGNMDYAPNVDAVQYFCREIWPLVKAAVPGARFVIAGQRPVKAVLDLAAPDIEITGFVPEIADEYARAEVVVAPLRFGAGTQNKVLEAIAMGVPVVCTAVGFKGLGIQSGEGAILSENAETFAKTVVQLLQDKAERKRVSSGGGELIRKRFDWDAVSELLVKYLGEIAGLKKH